jgi:hypothetical protein
MVSDKLKTEARAAWSEYGQAVVKAWNFPPGSRIEASGLEQLLADYNDERIRKWIDWVRAQAREVATMKYVGEP